MKTRALLLIAIMIGGAYALMQSANDYDEKNFIALLDATQQPFISMIFTQPSTLGADEEVWNVDDTAEIDNLLTFLQDYHVRKLKPEEISVNDDIEHFSIHLQDADNNSITILVNENLIIQNASLYYEIVDGPLDVDWLVQFFIHNRI